MVQLHKIKLLEYGSNSKPLITKKQFKVLIENAWAVRCGTADGGDLRPVVKLSTEDGMCSWLLTEIDPDDHNMAFGLSDIGLGEPKQEWIWLPQIQNMREKLGQKIISDQDFEPIDTLDYYSDLAFNRKR